MSPLLQTAGDLQSEVSYCTQLSEQAAWPLMSGSAKMTEQSRVSESQYSPRSRVSFPQVGSAPGAQTPSMLHVCDSSHSPQERAQIGPKPHAISTQSSAQGLTQEPSAQTSPGLQVQQVTEPQVEAPQAVSLQGSSQGAAHRPSSLQVKPASHSPQFAPGQAEPHSRSPQSKLQMARHRPSAEQSVVSGQAPQLPPQPSGPHSRP